MIKKIGKWGTSLALRLDNECNELDIKQGEDVYLTIEDNKIIIEKIQEQKIFINGKEIK